jgi:hypothetical protein
VLNKSAHRSHEIELPRGASHNNAAVGKLANGAPVNLEKLSEGLPRNKFRQLDFRELRVLIRSHADIVAQARAPERYPLEKVCNFRGIELARNPRMGGEGPSTFKLQVRGFDQTRMMCHLDK